MRSDAGAFETKKEGRASLVRRDGMHSNELAQNSPEMSLKNAYIRFCKGGGYTAIHHRYPDFWRVIRSSVDNFSPFLNRSKIASASRFTSLTSTTSPAAARFFIQIP